MRRGAGEAGDAADLALGAKGNDVGDLWLRGRVEFGDFWSSLGCLEIWG